MQGNQKDLTPIRGKIVSDPNEAHGIAFAALGPKEKFTKVYIQHPDLGEEDIRIRVTYSGICQSDVTAIEDKFPGLSAFPCIPGHEIIGRVVRVGSKATEFKEGELVGVGPIRDCCEKCSNCLRGRDNKCLADIEKFTINTFGGFSTSVQLPKHFVMKVPDGMNEKECAPLMCAGCTVFPPLKKWGGKDKNTAILGIGGLGHLAVQMSSKMGMNTTSVSTSDKKKDLITKLGSHNYVNWSNQDDVKKYMGLELDVILNTTNQGDVTNYMRGLRSGGALVQIGGPETEYKISPVEILMNEWILAGSAASNREDFREMLEFCNKNNVNSMNEHFKFEDFQKAYEKTRDGKPEFRVVVDMIDVDTSICKGK